MKVRELREAILTHPDWTLRQLGDSFGVTRQAVHDMLKRWRNHPRPRVRLPPRWHHRPLTVLRPMSDTEAAYVGALVDTDGCVPYAKGKYWYILFDNTEIELVANVLRLTGVGWVRYNPKEHKDMWHWGVYRREDVAALMQRLKPYSLKVQRALEKINAQAP